MVGIRGLEVKPTGCGVAASDYSHYQLTIYYVTKSVVKDELMALMFRSAQGSIKQLGTSGVQQIKSTISGLARTLICE